MNDTKQSEQNELVFALLLAAKNLGRIADVMEKLEKLAERETSDAR